MIQPTSIYVLQKNTFMLARVCKEKTTLTCKNFLLTV